MQRKAPRGSYRGIRVMRDYLILFSVKRECRKLFFLIRDLKVAELLTDIRGFTTLFSVIEWLELSIESDFDLQ